MAECDEIFLRLSKKAGPLFLRMSDEHQKTLDWLASYKQEIFSKIAEAESTKCKVPILPKTPMRSRRPKRRAASSSTDDEDHNSTKSEKLNINNTDNSVNSTGKPKRNASKLAEQKINKQSQMKLNSKMRRPGKGDTVLTDIANTSIRLNIKSERQSKSPINESVPQIVLKLVNVKMPPPAPKPKKGRKKVKKEVDSSDTENECVNRITRSKRNDNSSSSKKSSTRSTSKNRKDSDVILQEISVPVVVIDDSDTEGLDTQVNSEVESNTEDAKQVTDTFVEIDEDDRPLKPSRSKKKTNKQVETKAKKTQKTKIAETTEDSIYEDVLPTVNKDDEDKYNKAKEAAKYIKCTVNLEKLSPLNTTHVIENDAKISPLNTTHVLQKEEKITSLNTTHIVQKDATISPLNTTHVIQKEAKISPLNTTRVIENTTYNLNETHEIQKDNEQALKTKNCVTRDCSVLLQKMNETVTISKNKAISDKTVVLTPNETGHHWKKADISPPVDNLLTDDDDSIVKATSEKKPQPPRKGVKTKQMFNLFANSPVRKRVAAFEKLVVSDIVDAPTRVTRTKARNMKKENEIETSSDSSRIPTNSRYITPITNNKLSSLIPQSDSKMYRLGNKKTSVLPTSASATKPNKTETQLRREEQKKRLEKETDVKRKREALMQAKTEEQRKKREEKQLKAQKAREELEREKEEKFRQIIQEKEEEEQKKREWQAKKLAESEERKKVEGMMQLLKQREQNKQKQNEIRRRQLAMKPPPLPTEDCEDSDSSMETASNKKYEKPEWAQSQNISRSLMTWKHIPKHHIVSLWQMKATTPDLQEIFETIDEMLLRRNSSAVWRTPPRHSTLPKF